jgi:hypothetical protein
MEQPNLFDAPAAKRAATRGMEAALLRRGEEWRDEVVDIIRQVAARQELLTSDDVYRVLEERHMGAYCLRIIGPLMLRAARAGYIESTHTVRHSERVSMHSAWVSVWRSRIARTE